MTRISDMTPLVITSPTGIYVPVEKTGSTANYRVDLAAMSTVTPQMFHLSSDANYGNAFQSSLTYLTASALSGLGYGIGTASLFVPAQATEYDMGTTPIDLDSTTRIEGEGTGDSGGWASAQKWGANSHGYRIQYYGTSGDTTAGGTNPGGPASIISGLALDGAYNGTSVFEGEYHGIFARARFSARDLNIWNFQGDGIRIHGDSNLPESGNANGWEVRKSFFQNVRNALSLSGNNANQGISYGIDIASARQWGIFDIAGIQNLHIAPAAQLCGFSTNDGTAGKPVSVVTRGGQRYAVKIDQEVGASTNAPPSSTVTITIASPGVVSWTAHGLPVGTGVSFTTTGALPTGLAATTTYYVVNPATDTFQVAATVGGAAINTSGSQSGVHTAGAAVDNTWWLTYASGGVDAFHPAWFSGIAVRAGGPYYLIGSTLLHPYAEGGQPPCQFGGSVLRIGGTLGNRVVGGAHIYANSNQVFINDLFVNAGGIGFGDDQTGVLKVGRYSVGTPFSFIVPGATATALVLRAPDNSNGIEVSNTLIQSDKDLNINTGKVLKVAGTQVVGARDTGWAADTGTAKKTANATYTAGTTLTYSAAYVQSEQTAMAARVAALEAVIQNNSQTIKALKDAWLAHGGIGA